MTMEINEIGIRIRVRDTASASGQADVNAAGAAGAGQATGESISRDEIVDACVRRVLRALRTLQER
ncbi:DUF5908 family protein [Bradyrhizobium prioriisuperbiae]|uniref:DUF5908 family protein n=1 Tax=Bradyrhizobium prioriisuperbiae TaxID=2854389 RepID=UPI0028ECC25E|nr:DUF5908 family protein [Bradyrhizobium prioritasuperba]